MTNQPHDPLDTPTFFAYCVAVRAYMAQEWPTICVRMFNPYRMTPEQMDSVSTLLSDVVYRNFMTGGTVPTCASAIAEQFGMAND